MLPFMTSPGGKYLNIATMFPRISHFPTECHSFIPFVTSLPEKLRTSTYAKTSSILTFCIRLCLPSMRRGSFSCLNFSKNASSECYFGYNHSIRFLQTQVFLKCIFSVIRCKASECFCSAGPIWMIQYHSSESGYRFSFRKFIFSELKKIGKYICSFIL